MKCPECHSEAKELSTPISVTKGLIKVDIATNYWKCTNNWCKHEWSTHEQRMGTQSAFQDKVQLLNTAKDLRPTKKGKL